MTLCCHLQGVGKWCIFKRSCAGSSLQDTGISVRKRVIKILRDICLEQPTFNKITEMCVKMIRRVNDEEGIKVYVPPSYLRIANFNLVYFSFHTHRVCSLWMRRMLGDFNVRFRSVYTRTSFIIILKCGKRNKVIKTPECNKWNYGSYVVGGDPK